MLLDGLPLAVMSPADLGIGLQVDESGATYEENALIKALAYAADSGLPSLADDSGLEVDALGGEPGPRAARYAGEGATDKAR
ncbi:MAG: non-canonical purine NTP pyrophosphatase, partial [Chloroflexota bacterium]|nr:non-canonical purine NTP pyrophosphatase [Chloroflexota bacterium]